MDTKTPLVSGRKIVLLALFVFFASLNRVPVLDESVDFKYFVFAAECAAALILISIAVRFKTIRILQLLAVGAVSVKFVIGATIPVLDYGQTFASTAQEARFGVMLLVLPSTYVFLAAVEDRRLLVFLKCFLVLVCATDAAVVALLGGDGVISIGQRTDSRFFISIVTPFAIVSVLSARLALHGKEPCPTLFLSAIILFAHSTLITTSRTETLLSGGLLALLAVQRYKFVRWPVLLLSLGAAVWFATTYFDASASTVGGRDFALALLFVEQSWPLGFGILTDSVARYALIAPDNFFLSDYGVLLYFVRYGVIGFALTIILFGIWLRFALSLRKLNGFYLIAIPIILYLVFIPVLEYSSFGGTFILSLMLVTVEAIRRLSSLRSEV